MPKFYRRLFRWRTLWLLLGFPVLWLVLKGIELVLEEWYVLVIHWGWAHGGSVAAAIALRWWTSHPATTVGAFTTVAFIGLSLIAYAEEKAAQKDIAIHFTGGGDDFSIRDGTTTQRYLLTSEIEIRNPHPTDTVSVGLTLCVDHGLGTTLCAEPENREFKDWDFVVSKHGSAAHDQLRFPLNIPPHHTIAGYAIFKIDRNQLGKGVVGEDKKKRHWLEFKDHATGRKFDYDFTALMARNFRDGGATITDITKPLQYPPINGEDPTWANPRAAQIINEAMDRERKVRAAYVEGDRRVSEAVDEIRFAKAKPHIVARKPSLIAAHSQPDNPNAITLGVGLPVDDSFAALTIELRNDPRDDGKPVTAAKGVLAMIRCEEERATGHWIGAASPVVNFEVARSAQELVLAIVRNDNALFLINDRRPQANLEEREVWDAAEQGPVSGLRLAAVLVMDGEAIGTFRYTVSLKPVSIEEDKS